MGVPKKKTTKSKKGKRRAHQSLSPLSLIPCPHCQTPIPPHCLCPNCGYYKGRQVIEVKSKKAKRKTK